MNIKEKLIIENNNGNLLRRFSIYNKDNEKIKTFVSDFLTCINDREREVLAFVIMNQCLRPNQKQRIAGMMEIMNMFELFEKYDLEEKNRKHLVHQVNTFLLGLLFYNTNNNIKKKIDDWLQYEKERTNYAYYLDNQQEFYFRWKLASFTHDLGNGISLFGKNEQKFRKFLVYLESVADIGLLDDYSVDSLLTLSRGQNILELFQNIPNSIDLKEFWEKLELETGHTEINNYYDHGIMSALIVMKYIDNMYFINDHLDNPPDKRKQERRKIFFHFSIVPTMYAVAIHNLDFYSNKDDSVWEIQKFFDFNSQPFCWLLKISDILQEWDKSKAKDENNSRDADEIEYEITSNKIVIKSFPNADELKRIIDNYFVNEEIILVDPNC